MANKPDAQTAMRILISDIRAGIPFDTPMEELCNGPCTGCSKKLLDFLDTQLEEKETEINSGHIPALGELNRLKKTALKVRTTLIKNGLIKDVIIDTKQT
ncbi:hypothetical protein [Amphritea sp.]|uniref:hypothetical protein n=1 Tax=Amphritea sp. TaxID=1872502 RepID=UPI003A94DBF5